MGSPIANALLLSPFTLTALWATFFYAYSLVMRLLGAAAIGILAFNAYRAWRRYRRVAARHGS